MGRIARLLFAVVVVLGFAPAAVRAAEVPDSDAATIRALIETQIDAFRKDDGNAAYDLAAPGIQGMFGSPDRFMAMVRDQYQPVYRPRSVSFGPIVMSPMGVLQKVFLVGPDGKNYVAIYNMERQPDGTWRINGCSLGADSGTSI